MKVDLNAEEVEIILQAFELASCGNWNEFVRRYGTAMGDDNEDDIEIAFTALEEKMRALVS